MIEKKIKCPSCGYETTIQGKLGESKKITCPKCNKKGFFEFSKQKGTKKITDNPMMLSVTSLTKSFNGKKAVNNASFSVHKGEIFGFLGPNGAGKTTSIKAILGLLYPNNGQILIDNQNLMHDEKKIKEQVGYLPEKVAFYENLTALQNLEFYAEMKNANKSQCKPLLKEFGLADAMDQKVGTFSKGMNQRLGMARAIIGNPSFLILDEPSSGLDPRGVVFIREKIKTLNEQGATIFISSHILSEIQAICHRVGIINKGSIVAVDDISNLQNRLQLRPKLVLTLEKIKKDFISAVEAIEGVFSVKQEKDALEVFCRKDVKANVVLTLSKKKAKIKDIQTMNPSLEEVFMRFTEADTV
ncbi:MAG: ATP-binding cassette domain-containing protein [Candidatus Thermoplasmatota archaeon]|nr:ATP-binding cassette domain-containing protein [Candidatus Thermoplasmatota archaeon]MBS3802828.1 ATP-binding cassette domain-containing protein [Candidatus Thermoplasmatota archaeon]